MFMLSFCRFMSFLLKKRNITFGCVHGKVAAARGLPFLLNDQICDL